MITNIDIIKCSEDGCDKEYKFIEHLSDDIRGGFMWMTIGSRLICCECVEDICPTQCERNADKEIGWWCKEHYRNSDIRHYVFDDLYHNFYCDSCVKNCNNNFKVCHECDKCNMNGPYDEISIKPE